MLCVRYFQFSIRRLCFDFQSNIFLYKYVTFFDTFTVLFRQTMPAPRKAEG